MSAQLDQRSGELKPAGAVGLRVIRTGEPAPASIKPAAKVNRRYRRRNLWHFWRGYARVLIARALRIGHFEGTVRLRVLRANGAIEDLGIVSHRVVTTAGVNYIVDAFQNLVEPENMKFHGIGTGAAAEAVGDTGLGAELGAQYAPDNTRATGSTIEGGTANVYRTVGTNTVDAAVAITEHGIFSQAATGGGTLLDRSVFAAVNLAANDRLESTYDLTFNSGG